MNTMLFSIHAEFDLARAAKRSECVVVSLMDGKLSVRKMFDLPVEHPDVEIFYIGMDGFIMAGWESNPFSEAGMESEGVVAGPFYSENDALLWYAEHGDNLFDSWAHARAWAKEIGL